MENTAKTNDVPLSVALMGLGVLAGLYFYLESPKFVSQLLQELERYMDRRPDFIYAVLVALAINSMWIMSVVGSGLGMRRQGSRLELLAKGKRPEGQSLSWKVMLILVGAAIAVFFGMTWVGYPGIGDLPRFPMSGTVTAGLLFVLRLSFALSGFIALLILERVGLWKSIWRYRTSDLPEMPKPENGIVLGTTGEDNPSCQPEWVVQNRRALNGNVVVSASIGSGKTQGTILPYLDQILGNFQLRPSILAIDPKGTFIPEALKIIEKHGMSEHVLHMRLDGDVTFNPLYRESPLKGAGFMEIAQMIRAAAINFMGKSFDSPFWELSAFNLIKNTLVLCCVKSTDNDFGLTDLYSEMVEASQNSKKTATFLREQMSDAEGGFDEEERFNIGRAAKYFDECEQLDEKVKTGILATSTAFLNQFQEFQASRIFCPKLKDATLKTMDEVVDEGKFLLFDIANPALARSMGTLVKLHYEQSILNRLNDRRRSRDRTAVLIIDEYQDVVSTGSGATLGDERFLAKSREANAISIVATQSLTSLKNSIGREEATKELFQNFRTVIAGHSQDIATIRNFQELAGQEERTRVSHSVSESSRHPRRNLFLGGFEAADADISESISTSEQKEYTITGKEFSRLEAFVAFALVFDGVKTEFRKLFLKPHFLPKKNILHRKVRKFLSAIIVAFSIHAAFSGKVEAFPNICTVVKSDEFRSCLDLKVGVCMCGWPIPRPCARFSYYVPQTFIEVFPHPKSSYFGDLPGAAVQLATLGSMPIPFGAEADDDNQSFQAHALGVPFSAIPFSALPCGGARRDQFCFDAMSEHLGSHWGTGSGDLLQPGFLAWSLSPKACLLKGAATSVMGESESSFYSPVSSCSVPMSWLPKFPPSTHSACTGWGTFFPRSGVHHGPSQTTGALMIASRMKSLGAEVFHATPSSSDEFWQMIWPQSSSCFREGQNVGILDSVKNVREIGRLTSGKLSGYLFTIWSKVSCCRDLPVVPAAYAAIEILKATCQGMGAL